MKMHDLPDWRRRVCHTALPGATEQLGDTLQPRRAVRLTVRLFYSASSGDSSAPGGDRGSSGRPNGSKDSEGCPVVISSLTSFPVIGASRIPLRWWPVAIITLSRPGARHRIGRRVGE